MEEQIKMLQEELEIVKKDLEKIKTCVVGLIIQANPDLFLKEKENESRS